MRVVVIVHDFFEILELFLYPRVLQLLLFKFLSLLVRLLGILLLILYKLGILRESAGSSSGRIAEKRPREMP